MKGMYDMVWTETTIVKKIARGHIYNSFHHSEGQTILLDRKNGGQ